MTMPLPSDIDRFLSDVPGLIHVGANTGQERDLYASKGLWVLWVEALPDVHAILEANIASYARQSSIQALVTDVPGQRYAFHVASNGGASSSLYEFSLGRDIWPEIEFPKDVELVSTTLDRIVAKARIKLSNVGALVLDTQGSELLVLKGAERLLDRVRYVKTEAADFESYAGGATVAELTGHLTERGFSLQAREVFAERAAGGNYFELLFERRVASKRHASVGLSRGKSPQLAGDRAPEKAASSDLPGRFREILADPLNILIRRHPKAGLVCGDLVCLHNGHWVAHSGSGAYYGDFSAILGLNRGVHEPLEEFVFQELLDHLGPAPVMIELGAYWGHYAMWLAQSRDDARVPLVEPDPVNLAAGRANFARNNHHGRFIQATVGHGAFTIDEWMAECGLEELDILHVDIQGAELEMLDGAREALEARRVQYLFISTHSSDLHEAVISRLLALEYRIEVNSDFVHQTTSYDGFVFASAPRIAPLMPGFSHPGREGLLSLSPEETVNWLVDTMRKRRPWQG